MRRVTIPLRQSFISKLSLQFKIYYFFKKRAPKDHTTRFRSLEKHFPDLFSELDREFSTYRDTYSKIIDKNTCDRIRKIVEHDSKKYHIEE